MKPHFLFIILLVLASCKNTGNKENEALFRKVMEVHDNVMPKTDAIHTLKKNLGASLSIKSDSSKIFEAIKSLDDADEAMMVWMADFNSDYITMPKESQAIYLKSELEKITTVKSLIEKSIDAGNNILNSEKQEKK